MSRKYKVIRDSLHGDIIVEKKFLKIIDTKEFQRLRRIKQLSVGNMVFPGAEHTRFSHSIGTFFVMKKIIEHFDRVFAEMHIEPINEEEKDVALAAALLHDIGHGPFSHAFESILTSQCKEPVSHEEMSVEIILNSSSSVNKVLIEEFGSEFPAKVSDMIKKKKQNKNENIKNETDKPNLDFVLSSLISGQIDADRMDYLLRDSMFSGVKFGNIDIDRLVEGLSLGIRENEYCVCINEKYVPDVENYLSGRYQMHKEVYLHDFKKEMELIINKILLKAKDLFKMKKLNEESLPDALISLFNGEKLSIEDYVSLDDTILYSLFYQWKNVDDYELSSLCRCLLERIKFKKILVDEKNTGIAEDFKQEFKKILSRYDVGDVDFNSASYYLEDKNDLGVYKVIKDNIFVINKFGILQDLSKVSKLISPDIQERKTVIFINLDIFKECYKEKPELCKEVESLINQYDSRNNIEIEAKYIIEDESIFDEVLERIKNNNGYSVVEDSEKEQIDTYYDTLDFLLKKQECTLRIRELKDKYYCTIKLPTKSFEEKNDHSKRFEYENSILKPEITLCEEYIKRYLSQYVSEIKDLHSQLKVINKRRKFIITEGDNSIRFEMVLDRVTYKNLKTKKEKEELQVEIELKSDYIHSVRLKMLTNMLERKTKGLTKNLNSKYDRGIELTQ